jgi:hypothetical protein
MPMVVYTEEELIEACNKAAADASRDIAEMRDRCMVENTQLRRKLNDVRDAAEAFDRAISTDCDGPERDRLRAHLTLTRALS